MSVTLVETQVEGHPALAIETGKLALTVLPELGAKVISLVWKPSGRQHLWRQPGRPLRRPLYGDDFHLYDLSGWDECFPTIGIGYYPDGPWKGISLPDHGEVWALPWQWTWAENKLRMEVHSVRFGYHFERTFDFTLDDRIAIRYRVSNPTAFPFKALWSMHPFFNVSPASRVLLPQGASVTTEISQGGRFGPFLSRLPWPQATDTSGQSVDLAVMGPRKQGFVEKLFASPLHEGWSALYDADSQDFLAFSFDPELVPYMGICQIRDGWPDDEPAYTTILEPCSGWPDRLDIAVDRGAYVIIPAQGERAWTVTLQLGQGQAALEAAIHHTLDELR